MNTLIPSLLVVEFSEAFMKDVSRDFKALLVYAFGHGRE